MWKPDEGLDDYIVERTTSVTSKPPRTIPLLRTGEVEVLKPLTGPEVCVKPARTAFKAFRPAGPHQPLWFRRLLAVGSGALVMIALVLVSAILVGINDPVAGPDVATNGNPDLTQSEEPFSLDISSPSTHAPVIGIDIFRSNTIRRRTRSSIHFATNKPRRQSRPSPQLQQPTFVPTTLVIYAENGVINTRIEPWLQVGNKETPTFSN